MNADAEARPATLDGTAAAQTTVERAAIERAQAGNTFELLREVPGASVSGGVRAAGMSFNLRGYGDNEDVAVSLDGVPKSFEKYRYGGVMLEPELLRSLSVQRGPDIRAGAGALGGSVSATTRGALDFLRPGQRAGAQLRLGYGSGSHAHQASLSTYGRLTDTLALLVHEGLRNSSDVRLSGGQPLSHSAVDGGARLLKLTALLGDDAVLDLSYTDVRDSGLQPYDATGGEPGYFGTVQRSVRDINRALQLSWTPADSRWWDLKATVGNGSTALLDVHQPGQSLFANSSTGVVRDDYDYRNQVVDLANTAHLGPWGDWLLGLQWRDSQRQTARWRTLMPSSDGYEPSIPPGRQRTLAVYLQPRWRSAAGRWGALELVPGLRHDQVSVSATGGTAAALDAAGEASRTRFAQTSPSLGLAWDLPGRRVALFANIAHGFRLPLMDEMYTQGAYSRCLSYFLGSLAPASGICGSLYQPQKALNRELGLTLQHPDLLPTLLPGLRWQGKLTRYWIDTRALLSSITVVGSGSSARVDQPGTEHRQGVELESRLAHRYTWMQLAYSHLRGTVREDGSDASATALLSAPGDSLNLSWAWTPLRQLELGLSHRTQWSRRIATTTVPGLGTIDRQPGYTLLGLFASWTPTPWLQLRLSGDNLEDRSYYLNNGYAGAIGTQGPGRDLRLGLTLTL